MSNTADTFRALVERVTGEAERVAATCARRGVCETLYLAYVPHPTDPRVLVHRERDAATVYADGLAHSAGSIPVGIPYSAYGERIRRVLYSAPLYARRDPVTADAES